MSLLLNAVAQLQTMMLPTASASATQHRTPALTPAMSSMLAHADVTAQLLLLWLKLNAQPPRDGTLPLVHASAQPSHRFATVLPLGAQRLVPVSATPRRTVLVKVASTTTTMSAPVSAMWLTPLATLIHLLSMTQ